MKYKTDIKRICHLAWPAIIQEAMNTVVTYVDTAMVGSMGATASAAVGLTSSVTWLLGSISVAFGVGILAVCAQADGAKNHKKVQMTGQQALFISLVIGLLTSIISVIIAPFLPGWLNGAKEIRKDASIYFFIVSSPFIFRTMIIVLSSTLRAVKDMKTPMMINVYMNLINIVLNFILIYPTRKMFGITVYGAGLSVSGAAIASAISYVVGGVMIFRHYYKNQIFDFKHTGFHFHKPLCLECLKIATPVVMERSVICLGHVTFASLIAKLGVVPFATHTIAIQAEQAFYAPGYGFQSSVSTLVGNAVGEKDKVKVKRMTYLTCCITSSIMLMAGIFLFIFAGHLMALFTPDPRVIALGTRVLRIVSVSEPIYGILIILEGTFNGMGDTKAPFVFSLMTMWGIRIFGSMLMINVFSLGLESVWIMMVLDNVSRCLLLSTRFLSGRWKYRVDQR